MDGDLSKPPKKLAGLYRDLLKDAGKPCESYDPDCCVCKAWAAYAELEDFYAI